MNIGDIKTCLSCLKFTNHAKQEMLNEEFGEIEEHEIREALKKGEIIEEYSKDQPFPSSLVYGKTNKGRHLHVVCAPVMEEGILVIITVYEPDPAKWINFKRRTK